MREIAPHKTSSNPPGRQLVSSFGCHRHTHARAFKYQMPYNTGYAEKLLGHLLCNSLTWMVQLFNLQSQYNLADIRQRLITKQIYMPRVWFACPSPVVRESSHPWSVHTENPTLLRHPLYHRRSSCMQWTCCTSHRYSGLVCPNSVPHSQQTLTWKAEESFGKQGDHNLNSWYLCKLGMSRERDKCGSIWVIKLSRPRGKTPGIYTQIPSMR